MQALLAAKKISPEVANDIFKLFDQDTNGTIEYNEFVTLSFYVNELEYPLFSLSPLFPLLSNFIFIFYFLFL